MCFSPKPKEVRTEPSKPGFCVLHWASLQGLLARATRLGTSGTNHQESSAGWEFWMWCFNDFSVMIFVSYRLCPWLRSCSSWSYTHTHTSMVGMIHFIWSWYFVPLIQNLWDEKLYLKKIQNKMASLHFFNLSTRRATARKHLQSERRETPGPCPRESVNERRTHAQRISSKRAFMGELVFIIYFGRSAKKQIWVNNWNAIGPTY